MATLDVIILRRGECRGRRRGGSGGRREGGRGAQIVADELVTDARESAVGLFVTLGGRARVPAFGFLEVVILFVLHAKVVFSTGEALVGG